VAVSFKNHIPDFKEIVTGSFTIIPKMLEWFPLRVPWIMNLATGSVYVTVIITVDFDFLEILLQERDVALEKFLEIGFYA
jgi:hypothetical protein